MTVRQYLVILAILVFVAGCSRNDGGVPVGGQAPVDPQPSASEVNVAPETSSREEDLQAPSSPGEDGNTPPEIREVWFVGGDGSAGNTLGIEFVASDADGDAVQVDIEWKKNGEPAGTGKYVSLEVRRDDSITVTLVPSDGKTAGQPVNLTRKITNMPPSIQGHDSFQFDGNVASFQMLASDADGDALSYVLKDAPAGMTIDRNTGIIRWEVSPETTGKVMFTVEVSDAFGGSATAPLSITIAPQPDPEAR